MEELNLLIYVAPKFANCDDSCKDAEKTIRKLKILEREADISDIM